MRVPDEPHVAEPDHVRNVLFIMCDQLRFDALSCSGGLIDTPNIDGLAARGVRFDRAYVQGVTCGSSRMSYYTGRYVQTHGSRYNRIPLAINQKTMGDYLREVGVRTALVGKTHMVADRDSMDRLRMDPDDPAVMYIAECGFEPTERDDGLWPNDQRAREMPYNQFLRSHGFEGVNPWHSAANSVRDETGALVSGWLLRASQHAAIVPDELSETAYMTDRAIDFVRDAGDDPWCLHLSFIKPHWPYVVSAPFHDLVGADDVPTAHRSDRERVDEHPVLNAMRESRIGRAFWSEDVRRAVIPAYLGLVKQIDTHLGRLFAELDRLGRTDDTMVVLCSDHGDYLGDHWQGDKDWFHEASVRTPMIIADPRPAADSTRGTSNETLVEAIDLIPTFIEAVAGPPNETSFWLEGESLMPIVYGEQVDRSHVVSETDYGFLEAAHRLSDPNDPTPPDRRRHRATMLRTDRYKYILSETGPNLLYDLEDDPDEFIDRIDDPALATVQAELHEQLFEWFRLRRHDASREAVDQEAWIAPGNLAKTGVLIGYWDEDELERGLAGELY